MRPWLQRRAPYADRREAGEALVPVVAEVLAGARGGDAVDGAVGGAGGGAGGAVVLGLPRGGVPVAAPVAAALEADLDVLVVRKLGVPWHPELAMGAVAGVGDEVETVRNEQVLADLAVPEDSFEDVRTRETAELTRRERAYRGGRPAAAVRGRTAVVVDDGLATGSTMRAAVAALRRQQPARIVVAVPVGSAQACARLEADMEADLEADLEVDLEAGAVVCAWVPERFGAVGQAYRDFSPTSDEEVRALLRAAEEPAPGRPRGARS
jgi:putative phosphoribosyl transferase